MSLKQKVISGFRSLHRARKQVFVGDELALNAARTKINEEFRKHKFVSDEQSIEELLKYAGQVENQLRQTVIQIKEKKPGIYEARITKDTAKLDNVMFDENAIIKTSKKKCS